MNANGDANQQAAPRPMTPADTDEAEGERGENDEESLQAALPTLPNEDQPPRF